MEKVAPGKPGGEPFRGLHSLKAGDVTIENFTFLLGGPDEARMALRKLSVHGVGDAPGRIRFETTSPATLLIEIADATIPFDTVTGTFTMDGDRVNIARLTGAPTRRTSTCAGSRGSIHGYPLQVDYEASIDVPKSSAWWAMESTLKGRAALSGHITGPLASPVATATVDVPGFGVVVVVAGSTERDRRNQPARRPPRHIHARRAGDDSPRHRLPLVGRHHGAVPASQHDSTRGGTRRCCARSARCSYSTRPTFRSWPPTAQRK